jgi:hypothetical protein
MGLLGALWVVALTLMGEAATPGYDHSTQFISELGAKGAPHAAEVNLLGFLPAGIFMMLFAIFGWAATPKSFASAIGFIGMVLFALGYGAAAFFSCDAGCSMDNPSREQVLHTAFGLAGYVTAPLALFALSRAASRWPGAGFVSSLGIISALGAVGGFIAMLTPDSNYTGLAQRVLEGSVLIWVSVCSVYLGSAERTASGFSTVGK